MTNKPNIRIALTCIVKDDSEAKDFQQMLQSFSPYVDGLYVAITGTSGEHKKIKKIVKNYGGKCVSTSPETHPKIYSEVEGKIIFSNFAEARNVSWSLIDEEYDFITWADTDDILASGEEFRKVAELARNNGMDVVHFPYWYACRFDEKGRVTNIDIDHLRERLLKPRLFKWVSRLHEVAVPIDGFQPKLSVWQYEPEKKQTCVWIHTASPEKITSSVDRNRMILEIQAKEENFKDPRTIFYLAKTLFDQQKDDEAQKYLEKYLALSGWDAERANACEYLALIKMRKNNLRGALDTLFAGIKEYPDHPMLYLRIADCYFKLGHNTFGARWLNIASNLPAPKASATIGNKFETSMILASLKWNEAKANNDLDGMVHWAGVRKDLLGTDDGLYEVSVSTKNFNTVCNGVFNLAKWMKENGYKDKVRGLIDSLPREIGQEPFVSMIANDILEPKVWGDKEIAYYASFGAQHFEQWSPKNMDKGIGGSETAVIELAREWSKLGYKVTVYCDCGDDAGEYDGVIYKPYYQMNWNDQFNILILWRSPHLVTDNIKAKKLYMDLHDVPSSAQYTPEKVDKLDKIFVKSKYHRSLLPKIPDEKFVIIGNGIRRSE